MKTYAELAAINVGEHIEKKNGLSYLSWTCAVDQLLRLDPAANWSYGEPARWGETVMVFCSVHAFGRTRTAQLPVMDHRNKAIQNPDAMAVNTAMQRALAKAIALHGIGLYIYAKEDMPAEAAPETFDVQAAIAGLKEISTLDDLRKEWKRLAAAEKSGAISATDWALISESLTNRAHELQKVVA